MNFLQDFFATRMSRGKRLARDESVAPPTDSSPTPRTTRHSKSAASITAPPPAAPPAIKAEPSQTAGSEPADAGGLSAYELEREENIRRNNLMLASLNLEPIGPPEPKKAKTLGGPTQRGFREKKEKAEPAARRISLRHRGCKPDERLVGGVMSERADGTLVLANGDVIAPQMADVESEEPSERHSPDEICFSSLNLDEDVAASGDAAFLALLHAHASPTKPSKHSAKHLTTPQKQIDASSLRDLKLRESDGAKITKRGVCHMHFQPRSDTLLLAAADKDGHVGLWHVDAAESAEDDGVHLLKPHYQYVSGLGWSSRRTGVLHSCSYDGSIRELDAQRAAFSLVHSFETLELSALACAPDALWFATNEGAVGAVDVRAGGGGAAVAHAPRRIHAGRVNCLSLCPTREHILVSSSGAIGEPVSVWDVRYLSDAKGAPKPTARLVHPKSCQGAYLAPDGSGRVLTTCYDNKLRVWSDVGAPKPHESVAVRHDCHTGRWLLPLRAIWAPSGDGIICGAMDRSCKLFDANDGRLLASHKDPEILTAVPSRNAAHSSAAAIASATASGRVFVFRK
jgi:WD40 repeat protein|tara:strand:+ start:42 stop:1751 length:1710 start_codon:yes stop_codon:yes gene_type:complete